MKLDDAIKIMQDPTKHTMTLNHGELTAWLNELKEARTLLWDSKLLLSKAIFVNHVETKAADELYDKIVKIVGKE